MDIYGLWKVNVIKSAVGVDVSALVYDSDKGWFSGGSEDTFEVGLSPTLSGIGIQLTMDMPSGMNWFDGDEDVWFNLGISKYLGCSVNGDASQMSLNLGWAWGVSGGSYSLLKSIDELNDYFDHAFDDFNEYLKNEFDK